MKRKEVVLYAVWICMYILCVGLGTVDNLQSPGSIFFMLTALLFFVPGALLLAMGIREKSKKTVARVRIIAACSLGLTAVVFCANLMTVGASTQVGAFLHDLLNLVSAPMFCMRYWIVSLFLWASLFAASFTRK